MLRHHPSPTPFPYPTLFRSGIGKACARGLAECGVNIAISARHEDELKNAKAEIGDGLSVKVEYFLADMNDRSEEHTSELQSHHDLVCRLLLEKKKLYHRSST